MRRLALALLVSLLPQVVAAAEGRDPFEDPKAFLARIESDLAKVDRSIDATKELLRKSADSQLIPEIRLRLAELYVEKSRLLYYKALESRTGKETTAISAPESKYYKERAIEQYQKILREYPGFAQEDKVLFFLAHEYKELATNKEMLETYERLIRDHPRSEYVLESLLIVGNFHFDKDMLDEASDRYQQILRRTHTGIAAMARYKLAWIALNHEDYKEALRYFEAAAKTAPPGPGDVQLQFEPEKLVGVQRESLVDSVLPFTEVRKGNEALAYYEDLATDRFVLASVLDKLANRYFVQEEFKVSAQLYRTLLAMTRDPERSIEYARRIYDSEIKSKHPQWDAKDAILIADAAHRFLTDWRIDPTEQVEVKQEYEAIVRDIATRVHVAAKKARKPSRIAKAAKAYEAYLEVFTDDNKNRRAIELNHAEALYESKQYYEAGMAYETAARRDKANESDLIHGAIAGYQKVVSDSDAGRFRRVQSREGIKQLGTYYASLYPDGKDVGKIEFQVARAYYDAGDYEKALDELTGYISAHPRKRESYAAAHLILDVYSRLEDFEGLASRGRSFMQDPNLPNPKFRTAVKRIVRNAEFRRVSDVIAETAAEEDFETALLNLAKEHKGSELAEKALYNLYVAQRDGGDVAKTFDAGQRLMASYPASDFVPEVVTDLSKLALETDSFGRAASYYEFYARRRPKDKEATRTLQQAAELRAGLGDLKRAYADWDHLAGRPGAPAARSLARRKLLAARDAGDYRRLEQAGRQYLAQGDTPLARWAIGYPMWQRGEHAAAAEHLRRALALWNGQGSEEDREAAGHSAYLLAESTGRRLRAMHIQDANDTAGLEAMIAAAGEVETAYGRAVATGSGRWGVAAFYEVGAAWKFLASAVLNIPPPPGLPPEEVASFQNILRQQVAPVAAKANEAFATCVQKANELEVFSPVIPACATGGAQRPAPDPQPPRPRGTRPPASLVKALQADPGDPDLLRQTARGHLAAGDPYTAEMVIRRAINDDPGRADLQTLLGMTLLRRGSLQAAYESFRQAVESDSSNQLAQMNLAAHYFAYGDPRRARAIVRKVGDLRGFRPSGPEVHPAVGALLRASGSDRRAGPSARRQRGRR